MNFQILELDLEKAEEPEIKLPTFVQFSSASQSCPTLYDPDNHDGLITHLEPDILECEVKWSLESITTNKASGSDGIPVELFQILKDNWLYPSTK